MQEEGGVRTEGGREGGREAEWGIEGGAGGGSERVSDGGGRGGGGRGGGRGGRRRRNLLGGLGDAQRQCRLVAERHRADTDSPDFALDSGVL